MRPTAARIGLPLVGRGTMGVVLLLLLGTLPSGAQSVPGEGDGGFCFWANPAPRCDAWLILEAQLILPLAESSNLGVSPVDGMVPPRADPFAYGPEWHIEGNLGAMYNLRPTWSLGGLWTVGNGSGGLMDGVRGRVRWWRNAWVYLEGEAGIVRANLADVGAIAGPTVGARMNVRDIVTASVRYDRWDVPAIPGREGGPVSRVSAAVGLSGRTGVAGGAVLGLATLAVVLLLAGSVS
jgi:hypothetical protein